MIDFLFLYEVKNRELENIILIGTELERRGFSVAYLSFGNGTAKENIKRYHNNVDTVIMPSLYSDDEIIRTVYKIAGFPKRIINMQWEQVLPHDDEQDYDNYVYPAGRAKKAIHVCWGPKETENLRNASIEDSRLLMIGPVHMDFFRDKFKSYYMSKEHIYQKYKLNMEKKTVLFISSFAYVNMTKFQLDELCKTCGKEYIDSRCKMYTSSFDETIRWIDDLLKCRDDINFIYRPHPTEYTNKKLNQLSLKYTNFHVIEDCSIKQWIKVCDVIYTWISTSIVEAYFAGKNAKLCGL